MASSPRSPASFQPLEKLANDLRSHSVPGREAAARALTKALGQRQRESSTFTADLDALVVKLGHLAGSVVAEDGFAAVAGAECIAVFSSVNIALAFRLVNVLTRTFSSGNAEVARFAAKAYAHIIAIEGVELAPHVDTVLSGVHESFSDSSNEFRLLSGCYMVREIASLAPDHIWDHLKRLVDGLLSTSNNPSLKVRLAASDALTPCLALMREMEDPHTSFKAIQTHIAAALGSNQTEAVHGALLCLRSFIEQAKLFISADYKELLTSVFAHKKRTELFLREAFVGLLPVLAAHDPATFTAHFLAASMGYLVEFMNVAQKEDLETCLRGIGRVALSVSEAILPYIDPIIRRLEEGLTARQRQAPESPSESALFDTIGMLAAAVGPELAPSMQRLLERMLPCGLSQSLVAALAAIAEHLPLLKRRIQERVLDLVSQTLTGHVFVPAGIPIESVWENEKHAEEASRGVTPPLLRGPRSPLSPLFQGQGRLSAPSSPVRKTADGAMDHGGRNKEASRRPQQIVMAFKVLETFDFSGQTLAYFVGGDLLPYMSDKSADIKAAAIRACSGAMGREVPADTCASDLADIIYATLKITLRVAVTDSDPVLQELALRSITSTYDRHVARADLVPTLVLSFHDPTFSVRLASAELLGRCAQANPAVALPALRRALIETIKDLEYAETSRARIDGGKLLASMLPAVGSAARPLVKPLLEVLLDRARDLDDAVTCSLILALNELHRVGGDALRMSSDDILELLLGALVDRISSAKRLAALSALASLATNTGIVAPYAERPTLLPMLLDIMRAEASQAIRTETMRVLGFLGALDPFCDLARTTLALDAPPIEEKDQRCQIGEDVLASGPVNEDYWLFFALRQLLDILKDPSLSSQYAPALEAAMTINRTLRIRCAPFWPELVPALLNAMRIRSTLDELYLSMLSSLVSIMREHVGSHVAPILAHLTDAWQWSPALRPLLVEVIENLAVAIGGRFRSSLSEVLPMLLQSFDSTWPFDEETQTGTLRLRVFKCLVQLGPVLDDHLQLFLPALVSTSEAADMPLHVRRAALTTIERLAGVLSFRAHAGAVIHALVRMLDAGPCELKEQSMSVVFAIARNLDLVYEPFADMVEAARQRADIEHDEHVELVRRIRRGESLLPHLSRHMPIRVTSLDVDVAADAGLARQALNWSVIKLALETREWSKTDDWRHWLRRLSHVLLRCSPVFPLRACASMAESYNPLARDLFGPAFLSLYVDLSPTQRDDVVRALENVFASHTVPSGVCAALLNTVEYLERFDKVIPIAVKDLGRQAMRCHAYAKALHYKELEWLTDPTPQGVEDLVQINQALGQPDVAGGLLSMAQQMFKTQPKEEWFERLERWDEALVSYDRRIGDGDTEQSTALGRMRCLSALAQYELLAKAVQVAWPKAGEDLRAQIAPLAAASALARNKISELGPLLPALHKTPLDHAWFSAVLAAHSDKPTQAYRHLSTVRQILDGDLATSLGESYTRSYQSVVRAQMCSELEEVIEHKRAFHDEDLQEERRATIISNWSKRLACMSRDVEHHRRMLNIHLLIQSPREASESIIQFADIARRAGRLHTSLSVLNELLASEAGEDGAVVMRGTPAAIYSRIKLMFGAGEKEEALVHLRDLAVDLASDMNLPIDLERTGPVVSALSRSEPSKVALLARIYRKISHWQTGLSAHRLPDATAEMIKQYRHAIKLRPDWHKPFHAMALLHEEAANAFLRLTPAQSSQHARDRVIKEHVIPAIKAFYRSLALSPDNSAIVLQDTLRLLSLLFSFGTHEDVSGAIQEGLAGVRPDLWLRVIPQLQARLFSSPSAVRRLITQILGQTGRAHPQALIYPMAVASAYPNRAKRKAAMVLLDRLRDHSPKIVEQGLLIGRELVRVAILWHELWHEGLEDASRLYYNEGDLQAMFDRLEPLHAMMTQKGPETMREMAFEQSFGRDLREAYDLSRRYRHSHDRELLNRAWELYYGVFRKINQTLSSTTSVTIDLQYAAPKLLEIKDTEVSVPGTYRAGREPVRIASFARLLDVLSSKQHPRKLKIFGDDGKEYLFLLKGHEDLRQDERVMQFFGLVNDLLAKDRETSKRRLSIMMFSVVPLSLNSGLIGWVSNTDTLHVLVREYRQKRGMLFDLELKLMLQDAPAKYEKLTGFQQLEVFLHAMQRTSGQDLYRIMWLKSPSSEAWLERRTTYTRSLAVMSMVGYLLGLGDRHPSNLLFHRRTGEIMHVDFGDCFGANRERYPETVPFRLTRMLTQAMEVSGIDGTFRTVCEKTIRVLRDNRESLLALLAAFVHDPLVNWRIGPQRAGGGASLFRQPTSPTSANATNSDEQHLASHTTLDKAAVQVIDRVQLKLVGRDFGNDESLVTRDQVDRLIREAQDPENLSRLYLGWCSFW